MSTDRPDDLDAPILRPLPPDDREIDLARDYGEEPPPPGRPPGLPPLRPGFGFWMAVVWCVLYVLVMQILAAIVCGLPIYAVAMGIEIAQNGPEVLQDQAKLKAWMDGDEGRLALMATLVCSHLVGLLFGWLVLRWQVGRHWPRVIALTRRPSATHAALVLIGFPALLALGAAIEQPIMKYVPSVQDLLDRFGLDFQWPGIEIVLPLLQKTPWPLALFAVAVLPAINEEVWCRGFLGQGLSARYAGWAAVLATSFLFGLIHLEPRQGLWAVFLGAAIHAAYLATRSLPVAMGIHFVNNGLAVVHYNDHLWPVLKPLEELLERSPVLLIAGAALLFGAVVYALYQTRSKLAPEMEGMPVWEPRGEGGAELPPPGSGTVVTHDPLSPLGAALVAAGAVAFGLVLAFA